MKHPSGQGIHTTLLLLLGTLFFILAMGITLLASGIYRHTVAVGTENFNQRTALSYLVNQVRRCDLTGGISCGSFGGSDALFLREGDYVTILYCYDGQLRELYQADDLELQPSDGLAILPLQAFTCTTDQARLIISVQTHQATYRTILTPRSSKPKEVAA